MKNLKNEEIWKPINGYENLYLISNFGNVKSLKNNIILKQDTLRGYKRVALYSGSRKSRKIFQVHRLVAYYFLPNPNNLPQINHIDENKANNHVENLEWCDAKYNSNYGTRKYKIGLSNGRAVLQYTKNGIFVNRFDTIMDAQRNTSIINQSISACCSGKRKTAGGYIWKYAN